MHRRVQPPRKSALFSFRFLGTALVGSLTMALVAAYGPESAQLAMLGALVSILGGLFLSYLEQEQERDRRRGELLERLAIPLALAPEHELYDQYVAFSQALTRLAGRMDPILQDIALLKLASVGQEITSLADGTVVFSGTEAWRTVYEKLLKSPDIHEYLSVAWVRTPDYWQDAPGKQSTMVNFEANRRGVLIERIVILRDELWPAHEIIPGGVIGSWIEAQHNHALRMYVVRESQVASEPDLLADIGIYGDRALGTQELDERSRTVRFVLQFDPHAIRMARERWKRLSLFATPYYQLLDQTEDPR